MPRTPKGHKRPADVIGNTVHVMKIATGEIEEAQGETAKDPAAVALGRKGGLARAKKLTEKQRSAVAAKAANARWRHQRKRSL